MTPLSDAFHHHRPLFFSLPCLFQILGLLLTTYHSSSWVRYGGLLIVGFGLGPTVPITMTWTNEIFQPRHGEVGVAAASALVSGLGNLGSIVTTYALYDGWPADARASLGTKRFRKSNLVMVGMVCTSFAAAWINFVLLKVFRDRGYMSPSQKKVSERSSTSGDLSDAQAMDGAARRELQERGLGRLWVGRRR